MISQFILIFHFGLWPSISIQIAIFSFWFMNELYDLAINMRSIEKIRDRYKW